METHTTPFMPVDRGSPPLTSQNARTFEERLAFFEGLAAKLDGETPAQHLARKLEEERIKRELEEFIKRMIAFAADYDLDLATVFAKVEFDPQTGGSRPRGYTGPVSRSPARPGLS